MDAISVENLVHTYPVKRPAKEARRALNGVSFAVRPGEIFGLLGPNGGGKSTLFHILSTYFPPTGGSARLFGLDVLTQMDQVRRLIGVVFQSPGLDAKLTIDENLMHQGHLYGLSGKTLRERIDDSLRRVGLTERSRDFVDTLSGGMKRRVELAKGLLHHPKLLLLDEPTTGLDPVVRRDIWSHLKNLQKEGTTVAFTTHLMDEAELCDRVAILNHGELVALGQPSELKAEIGGDIIWVQAQDPELFLEEIERKLQIRGRLIDGVIRIEIEHGHSFIPRLVDAFPGRIQSVSLSQPSLEDVFIRKTGHRFGSEEAAA